MKNQLSLEEQEQLAGEFYEQLSDLKNPIQIMKITMAFFNKIHTNAFNKGFIAAKRQNSLNN